MREYRYIAVLPRESVNDFVTGSAPMAGDRKPESVTTAAIQKVRLARICIGGNEARLSGRYGIRAGTRGHDTSGIICLGP